MELIELGSILHMTKGKKPKVLSVEQKEGYLPYVDIEAFESGKVKKYTNGENCTPCEDGDILIVCDGSRSGLVGRAIKGFVGSTLAKIDADGVSNDYLYRFVQGKYLLLTTNKKGTGTPHLKAELLKSQKLFVPNSTEQNRIVSRLDELLTQLDEGIGTLLKTHDQLEVYRQAVLKSAFEKIDADEKRLEDICYFITKGTTPAKDKMSSGSGDIPYIKVYNLTFRNLLDFSIDPTFVDFDTHKGFLARSIVLPGDVLMNIVGPPMGKVSIVPDTYPEWNINQAIARFRCKEELDNKYLAYFLGYAGTVAKMKSKAKATAGQFNLTLEICRDLTIPLPDISMQKSIVNEIDKKISQCEEIQNVITLALQQARAMRQSILKQAFEGRL